MLKELSWYLEDNRFTNLVTELDGSLKRYEAAKRENMAEESLTKLREESRLLFEDHCVRSGMREEGKSFINIDAEFFSGDALDQEAADAFIKNIIKGHCYQKVLWTYMGTTGLMTVISKDEMAKQGLRYEDYLPIEYKKKNPPKKPMADLIDKNTELFYMYADGTISKEYYPEKAKIRFDRLTDKSGIDWKKGYDPNGEIKKDGWHGEFDHSGTWVRVEENKATGIGSVEREPLTVEVIKSGDAAILYDPGMRLLSSPLLMYMTEKGEAYGNLEMDLDKTIAEIREAVKKLGAASIRAICGIAPNQADKLEAYKEVLKDLAAKELSVADSKAVNVIREENERKARELEAEGKGVGLERKLYEAGKQGARGGALMAAAVSGKATGPLSPRNKADGAALGLSEEEIKEISALPIREGAERLYDTVLSNLYASWALYEGSGLGKGEAARMVKEHIEGSGSWRSTVAAITSLGDIIRGGMETVGGGVTRYTSCIPGVFSKDEAVDFYEEEAKEKYVKSLERKKALPKGGAEAALAALKTLPIASGEKKAELSRGLSRALGQYKAIAMSAGMPILELIETVKATVIKGENPAALGKKIYYELSADGLIKEAGKENLQRKETRLDEERKGAAVVIGGASGKALDEVLLPQKLKKEYGLSEEEAEKAKGFLHSVRLASPVIPLYIAEALSVKKASTAKELQKSILGAIERNGEASYNLGSEEGIKAYLESSRAKENKLTRKDIEELLEEGKAGSNTLPSFASKLEVKYRAQGGIAPLTKSAPKGTPEKIHLAKATAKAANENNAGNVSKEPEKNIPEQPLPLIFGNEKKAVIDSKDIAELGLFNEELLKSEYGYRAKEAKEAVEYLKSIYVPNGKEAYFSQSLLPVFIEALRGTNKAAALRERISEAFRTGNAVLPSASPQAVSHNGDTGAYNTPSGISNLSWLTEGEAVPFTIGSPKASAGGKAGIGSIDVAELGAFNEELLKSEYGYSAKEAKEAVEYLKSIYVPTGKEAYFSQSLSPVFIEALRGTNKASALKERISEAFRTGNEAMPSASPQAVSYNGDTGAYNTPSGIPNLAWLTEGEAVPFTTGSPKASADGKAGIDSIDVAELGAFNEELLKDEYGYAPKEAKEAVEYLRSIHVPNGKEAYFSQSLSPVFIEALRGTNKASVLKERISEALRTDNVTMPSVSQSNAYYSGGAGAYNTPSGIPDFAWMREIEAVPFTTGNAARSAGVMPPQGVRNPGSASNMQQESAFPQGMQFTSQGISSIPPILENDTPESEIADYKAREGAKPIITFPKKPGKDAEIERLRRIEANYEKDKAMLARQKQPALARSESHDVGHAEGEGSISLSKQEEFKLFQDFKGIVKDELKYLI